MVSVRNLTVDYGGRGGRALSSLSFDLPAQGIVGIAGESGSGKTTLAHALLGILPPYARVEGKIFLDGEEITALSEEELRELRGKKIAMIFQSAQNALHPCYRVVQQALEIIAYKRNCSLKEAYELFKKEALSFGLTEKALHCYPHQLSGGMKQRAYIALVLALSPQLIIADEPTTALDVLVQAQVLRGLKEAAQKLGNLILFISHDLITVLSFADEVIILYGGEIMEKGKAELVGANPLHPYTRHLMKSVVLEEATPELFAPAQGGGCPFYPSCPIRQEICWKEKPQLAQKEGREVACHAL